LALSNNLYENLTIGSWPHNRGKLYRGWLTPFEAQFIEIKTKMKHNADAASVRASRL